MSDLYLRIDHERSEHPIEVSMLYTIYEYTCAWTHTHYDMNIHVFPCQSSIIRLRDGHTHLFSCSMTYKKLYISFTLIIISHIYPMLTWLIHSSAWHTCSLCCRSSYRRCYTCPNAFCSRCLPAADFLQIKGNNGFCEICLKLALLIEENKDYDSDSVWLLWTVSNVISFVYYVHEAIICKCVLLCLQLSLTAEIVEFSSHCSVATLRLYKFSRWCPFHI